MNAACEPHTVERWIRALQRHSATGSVVVLDLDLTLADNTPRTRRILAEYVLARHQWSDGESIDSQRAIDLAQTQGMAFSILENFRALGIEDHEIRQHGIGFWKERFFDGAYCVFDVPYAGAASVVRSLLALGHRVAYTTARIADRQAAGTVQWLCEHGFPICVPGTALWMKPDAAVSDSQFKADVCRAIAEWGTVSVAVDNEPGHCNGFAEAFDEALVVWMRTRHSPGAPPPRESLVQMAEWGPLAAALAGRVGRQGVAP